MKPFLSLLATLTLAALPAFAEDAPDPYLRYPAYVRTMQDLNSDYAKKKYPPVKLKFPKVTQVPTTLQSKNLVLFRNLQIIKVWSGRVDALRLAGVTAAISEDFVISEEEAQVIELLKKQTPFTLSVTETPTSTPRQVSITPKCDAAILERLSELQKNGIELKTHEVMSRQLLRKEKFADWVKLYQSGGFDSQLALSILRRRFILATGNSTYNNNFGPARDLVREIKGWIDSLPAESRKPIQGAIFDDLTTTNTAMGTTWISLGLLNPSGGVSNETKVEED